MKQPQIRLLLFTLLVLGIASACKMSASQAPTAFAFPTATLSGTSSPTSVLPSTSVPVITITPSPTQPLPPTNTLIPVVTATSAPTVTMPPTITTAPLLRSVGKIVATFLQTPPNVDGNLSQWTLQQYPVDYVVYGKDEWTDAQDLSAKVMVGWDHENLYLGVHVTDNRYVQTASGEDLYLGDSLEVLLDTNLQADFYVNRLSPDDFQLGIGPGSPEPGNDTEAYLWFPRTVEGLRSQVKIAAKPVDSGYDVEVSIPWSVFEVTPAAGQHFGFTFSVSDNDKKTDDVQQSMVSSAPNRHLTNPTTWGDLLLGLP